MNVVYVLRLEEGKYYVGKTTDLEKRFREHKTGYRSSAWTKKYKPIEIHKTYPNCDGFDEDKITVMYMTEHGISNVRGGPYVTIKLPTEIINHITLRIRMATNLCLKCGSKDHFCTRCSQGVHAIFPDSNNEFGPPICANCGVNTHFTEDCEFAVS
jgi:hypothetical protein